MARRTVTTQGSGRTDAPPDRGVVVLEAVGHGDTAAVARGGATDHAATVRETLPAGVAARTLELRVHDEADAFCSDGDPPYRAVETVRVDCEPDAVGDVVVAGTDAGATVEDVRFELREETRRALADEAVAAAVADARRTAERMARAEGRSVAGVREMTTVDREPTTDGIVDDALAATGPADVHPQPVEVAARVEATYDLAEER